eukprot:m.24665 g.24665  ORF g.24665 m.24665 type:complete len:241 (+) comp9122_c0_seq13:341-1063(+)
MFQGLPYIVPKEAIRLLLENGKAQLWRYPSAEMMSEKQLHEEVKLRQEERLGSIRKQLNIFSRQNTSNDNMMSSNPKPFIEQQDSDADDEVNCRKKSKMVTEKKWYFSEVIQKPDFQRCRVIVPHVPARWLELRRPLPPRAFKYPFTLEEERQCKVYSDLVMKGYFLTGGIKFGGDFLVYPGDPIRFHSHFVAIITDKTDLLHPLDLVAMGRLGTTPRKKHTYKYIEAQKHACVHVCIRG